MLAGRGGRRWPVLLVLGVALLVGGLALLVLQARDGTAGVGATPDAAAAGATSGVAPSTGSTRTGPRELRRAVAADEAGVPPVAVADPALRGRVVEAARPSVGVSGALVGDRLALNLLVFRDPTGAGPLPANVARTDDEGAFSLAEVDPDAESVVVVHFDYAPAAAERPTGGWDAAGPVVIPVERGPHVYGTVLTDGGEPAEGVFVRVFGEGWPRGVHAFADGDGNYRTPAVHPGPIDVIATAPAGSSGQESGFTREWRSAEIGTTDLRVDFGPGPHHVTWRGRVLDEQGDAVDGGRLHLTVLDAPGWADPARQQLRTAQLASGSFELAKLRPGVLYAVALEIEAETMRLDLDEVRFDTPGIVERDLRLADHTISGVVVDRDTGGPPAEGGAVFASRRGATSGGRHVAIDAAGGFRLRGLASGVYDLYVHAEGYASAQHEGVRVGAGTVGLEPVRIEVSRGASLTVRLADHAAHMPFEIEFESDGAVRRSPGASTDEAGAFEGTWTLLPGSWTVHLRAAGVGRAARVVTLRPGGAAEALFLPADLERFEGRVAVEGRLRRAGGEPVEGAHLFLFGVDAELPADEDRQRKAITDAEGRFRAEGFLPGRWRLSGVLAGGAEVRFDDLVVPARPPDPVLLQLVLPEGGVRGRLVDGSTGIALAEDGPAWWAFLREAETEHLVAELQGGHRGPTFELTAVPGGRYRLLVKVRGYFDHSTPAFDLGEGELRDLGELELSPSAVLSVEVRGPDGQPLQAFSVLVDGAELHAWRSYDHAPGQARWDGLAEGPASVEVRADGMVSRQQVVTMHEGAVSHVAFELERE